MCEESFPGVVVFSADEPGLFSVGVGVEGVGVDVTSTHAPRSVSGK